MNSKDIKKGKTYYYIYGLEIVIDAEVIEDVEEHTGTVGEDICLVNLKTTPNPDNRTEVFCNELYETRKEALEKLLDMLNRTIIDEKDRLNRRQSAKEKVEDELGIKIVENVLDDVERARNQLKSICDKQKSCWDCPLYLENEKDCAEEILLTTLKLNGRKAEG